MSSVYQINTGINRPIEFKGLKAQYIWYLGGGIVALLIVFAVLYIAGVNPFICITLIGVGGTFLFMYVYRLSRTHGEFGVMKKIARRGIPSIVRNDSIKNITGQLQKK